MPARVRSAALQGIEAVPVEVEVEVLAGLPSFTLVGMTDRAIQEARERMTAALTNLGYTPPRRKTIVSLAPASLKKEGSLYDLPITIGFLLASEQIKPAASFVSDRTWFAGELGLDGAIRGVRGILPIALAAAQLGVKELYIPKANAEEAAAAADQLTIYAVGSLKDLLLHLEATAGSPTLAPLLPMQFSDTPPPPDVDFADIRGQDHAKRALVVAASAHHNVLLVGPPGTGKTLLARALAGILPPLRQEESHVVTSLYSIAGLLPQGRGLIRQRPFRNPHHGASSVALVGGGSIPKPGEVSLAHHGVLFLDELPEFSRQALEQLRQPIEDGFVTVARAAHSIRFPARSMLIGAMNPCKCGFQGSEKRACRCSPADVFQYQKRISGPLLDRFDLQILVSDVPLDDLLASRASGPSSQELRQLVATCRERQQTRQGKPNSDLTPRDIKKYCAIEPLTQKLLYQAMERFHLSARSIHRLLKVARTIADLADKPTIQSPHLAEALQYREQIRAALPDFV